MSVTVVVEDMGSDLDSMILYKGWSPGKKYTHGSV